MSFAPILDPSAISGGDAVHRRKAVRAAGFALRRLATTNAQLLSALSVVENSVGADPQSRSEALSQKFSGILSEVAEATGTPQGEILESVIEQLRQVVEFANLDGGHLEANVGAVGSLIRSGRVELFAG